MSTYIKKSNGNGQFVSDQQATMLYEYNNNIYSSATNELKKKQKFIVNRKTGEHIQWGGAVYLTAGDDLNTIVNQHINIGRSWAFYYNKQTNNKGDVQWEAVVYIKGVIKVKRIEVFDIKGREVAFCEIDLITGQKKNKRKAFFGDPTTFYYSFGDENFPNITFFYKDDNSIREIYYYDDDYTFSEFTANTNIMTKFPWGQHTYFHSFNPILPPNIAEVAESDVADL